jgi:hypothetical protein
MRFDLFGNHRDVKEVLRPYKDEVWGDALFEWSKDRLPDGKAWILMMLNNWYNEKYGVKTMKENKNEVAERYQTCTLREDTSFYFLFHRPWSRRLIETNQCRVANWLPGYVKGVGDASIELPDYLYKRAYKDLWKDYLTAETQIKQIQLCGRWGNHVVDLIMRDFPAREVILRYHPSTGKDGLWEEDSRRA